MKLYLVEANRCDYDEYDSFVILAHNEDEAKSIANAQTNEGKWPTGQKWETVTLLSNSASTVNVGRIPTIIHSSFNAG